MKWERDPPGKSARSKFRFRPPRSGAPVLSQTDWINRSIGLPPVEYDLAPRPEGGSFVTARARLLGTRMRWRELPFEWLAPEYYRVHRIFETGPFKEARLGLDLHAQPGGTRIVFYSNLEPRHALGRWLARRVLGPKATRDMRGIVAQAEQFLRGQTRAALPRLPVSAANETALQTGLKKLGAAGEPAEYLQLLEALLREAPDVELSHLRPFVLAQKWSRDPWAVTGLFLRATRCGLLDLSWEILCPNCRSSPQPAVTSLSQLKRDSHCDVCQIRFDAEFDKSVELKFAVNRGIRPRDEQTFCLAWPGGKPHIASQLWLQPHEERLCRLPDLAHSLRLRSAQVREAVTLQAGQAPARGERLAISCETEHFWVRKEDLTTGTEAHARRTF